MVDSWRRGIAIAGLACAAPLAAAALDAGDGVALATQGRFDEARAIWEEVGDGPSLRNLAGLHVAGVLGQADLVAAKALFREAAARGDAPAMLGLGHMALGDGVDTLEAETWFRRAADLGLVDAKVMLGRTILGRPTTPDEVQDALALLNEAGDAHHPQALMMIGDLLRGGTYTARDLPKAVSFYELAAAAGAPEASDTLGDIHAFGELGAPDLEAAVDHYARAASGGVKSAMLSLAYMFYRDPGSDADRLSAAFRYAHAAALVWEERAQLLLGHMYLAGRAVPRDPAQAHFWFDLAASAGVVEAHHMRGLTHMAIGADEAARMREAARRWFDENHATPHTHRLLGTASHNFR
ncbi:tetratricopeptide repeat protein [Jannaschia sp. LMIT008]|uniref:tetratricopeptide repeat protein n=1 Tax=Jannaschia maritima TaxID=3032585 RepID=UPI002810FCD5|nr:tetratricopeptide repeat protein [Jannaschia sp. LMIT008]